MAWKSFRIHEPWKYWPSSFHFLHENRPIFRPRSRIRVSWLMIMKLLITTGLVKARWNTWNTRGKLARLIFNRVYVYIYVWFIRDVSMSQFPKRELEILALFGPSSWQILLQDYTTRYVWLMTRYVSSGFSFKSVSQVDSNTDCQVSNIRRIFYEHRSWDSCWNDI